MPEVGAMRANVKPLTHWIIYKGYTVRFTQRSPDEVAGLLTTPQGQVAFRYEPQTLTIHLPDRTVRINEFGWEESSEMI
jgi:hypothetical protein